MWRTYRNIKGSVTMKKITIYKIIISIIIALSLLTVSTYTFAGITPDQITGESNVEVDLDFIDTLTDAVRIIGVFVAVGALMVIGIKYVTGSIEEKANYKKTMIPYIVGCFVLFGASVLAPQIKDFFTNAGSDAETIGNSIIGLIQAIGTLVTVGVLMILGIKYMMGSTEERASYKKTMLPYVIGVILIFAAVNLTAILYNMAPQSSNTTNQVNQGGNTTSTSGRYERNEDGEPICRNCGDVLSAVEQRRGVCSECGERTGI